MTWQEFSAAKEESSPKSLATRKKAGPLWAAEKKTTKI
jgi:hypothetical protein